MLGGARINANFAYTNSKNYNLVNRTDTPQLVGQAPFSWNIGPSYATKRALVTVGDFAQQREYLCLSIPEHRAGRSPLWTDRTERRQLLLLPHPGGRAGNLLHRQRLFGAGLRARI